MDDMKRYRRQMAVSGIGADGQRVLRNATVAVIGCGALGSLAAMYLAGAGVGRLVLADFDTVDISNLQRQLFYKENQAGQKKVVLLGRMVSELNSEVEVVVQDRMITRKTGIELLASADLVIDATDNPASKYCTDYLCKELSKPCCIGGVEGMRGQLITILPGDERYADLFPDMPDDPGLTPCTVAGVLGPAAGVVASMQAAEAIKFFVGAQLCRHKLFDFDLASMRFDTLQF